MSKLSDKIEFAMKHYCAVGERSMTEWLAAAKGLEARVASVEQLWVRDMRDLKEVITARYQDISDLKDKVAELQRMNDNQFAQLEANDKTIKELQQDKNDSQARAENLNDKLRATKAELEGCRVAYKGKKEQVDGLRDQLRGCDQLIVALRQEGEHLRRSISEDVNTVALNKHIAKLTEENQQKHKKIGELLGENAAAHTAARTYTNTIRRMQDIDKNQLEVIGRLEKQTAELQRMNENQEATIKRLKHSLADSELLASLANQRAKDANAEADRHHNQSGYVREYQKEISQLREQLEAEKAKPAVVAHRYVEITGFDSESNCALCSVSSYGTDGKLLEAVDSVPLI